MHATIAVIFSPLLLAAPGAATAQEGVERYVRYDANGATAWGQLDGETIHELTAAPYLGGERTGRNVPRSTAILRAPVEPRQIFMTAYNFLSHIAGEPAPYPGIFLVPPSSIIGPEEDIVRPRGSNNLHYEAEMVGVVGREARNVSVEDAPDYLFGVSAGNDVSERNWQNQDLQWTRAKGSRTFNAVGPVLVRGLDYHNVRITGRLNGELRQTENTSDLLYDLHEMLSYISTYFTLYPGDLIWTGTMGTTSQMQPGDVYEVEVEGIGILRNPVVQEN